MPLFSIMNVLALYAFFPVLITFFIGISRIRVANKQEKLLILLIGIALLTEVISSLLWRCQLNNLFISHVYVPIELFLLLNYFRVQITGVWNKIIGYIGIGFVLFSIIDSTVIHSMFEMNNITRAVECILLILLSLTIWGRIMKKMQVYKLTNLPLFWINSAVLVYFSAVTLLFIFSNSILSASSELGMWVWSIHFFFMTVYYTLFSIGLWKIRP